MTQKRLLITPSALAALKGDLEAVPAALQFEQATSDAHAAPLVTFTYEGKKHKNINLKDLISEALDWQSTEDSGNALKKARRAIEQNPDVISTDIFTKFIEKHGKDWGSIAAPTLSHDEEIPESAIQIAKKMYQTKRHAVYIACFMVEANPELHSQFATEERLITLGKVIVDHRQNDAYRDSYAPLLEQTFKNSLAYIENKKGPYDYKIFARRVDEGISRCYDPSSYDFSGNNKVIAGAPRIQDFLR